MLSLHFRFRQVRLKIDVMCNAKMVSDFHLDVQDVELVQTLGAQWKRLRSRTGTLTRCP